MPAATRLTLASCLALLLAFPAHTSTPTPTSKQGPKAESACADAFGDPLPAGARARLGSVRFRPTGEVAALRYLPDGQRLLVPLRGYYQPTMDFVISNLARFDGATGRELTRIAVRFNDALTHETSLQGGGEQKEFLIPARWAVSPNGRLVAEIGGDGVAFGRVGAGRLRVRDIASGKVVLDVQGAEHFFTFVQFTPDSKRVAAVDSALRKDQGNTTYWAGAYVRFWDLEGGKESGTLAPPAAAQPAKGFRIVLFSFSPDGRVLAALGREDGQLGVLRLWDVGCSKGSRPLAGAAPTAGAFAFSPDCKQLAEVSRGKLRLWNTSTGKQIKEVADHPDAPEALDFSPDGKRLVSGTQGQVRLWDLAGGRELKLAEETAAGYCFSPDGRSLAVASHSQAVHLYELATGKEVRSMKMPVGGRSLEEAFYAARQGLGQPIAFAPDGKVLAVAPAAGPIRRWDVAAGTEILPPGQNFDHVDCLAFSPDGKLLAAAGTAGVSLWDAAGMCLRTLESPPALEVDKDGNLNILRMMLMAEAPDMLGGAVSVVFSPDGRRLAVGWYTGTVSAWDAASGRCLWRDNGGQTKGMSLAFSANGNAILSGGADGCVLWWDAATGRRTRTLRLVPQDDESAIRPALSRDGRIAITAGKDGMEIWELATGRRRGRPPLANLPVRMSPNGRMVLQWKGPVARALDLARDTVRVFTAPSDITDVVSSLDGKILAAGDDEGTISLWETATGTLLKRLRGDGGAITALAFAPDGHTLAAASAYGPSLLWDVAGVRRPVQRIAPTPAALAALWDDLAAEDAERAARALARLLRAPETLDLLRDKLQPTHGAASTADTRRGMRAVELLERNGLAQARAFLRELTEGSPEARLTQEARAALHRLPAQEAGPAPQLTRPEKDPDSEALPRCARLRLGSPRFQHPKRVAALRYLSDGKGLLSVTKGSHPWWAIGISTWDAGSGDLLNQFETTLTPFAGSGSNQTDGEGVVNRAPWCLSRDGRLVATIATGLWSVAKAGSAERPASVVTVSDVTSGKTVLSLTYVKAEPTFLEFMPDGNALAVACAGLEPCIRLYELPSGKQTRRLVPARNDVGFVPLLFTIARDGKRLAARGRVGKQVDAVLVWDLTGDRPPLRLNLSGPLLGPLVFSPDGKLLALASASDKAGEVRLRLWDAATGKVFHELGRQPGWPEALVFSPDGKLLAAGRGEEVRWWEVHSGKPRSVLAHPWDGGLLFSPDSRLLAVASGGRIVLYDAGSGQQLRQLQAARPGMTRRQRDVPVAATVNNKAGTAGAAPVTAKMARGAGIDGSQGHAWTIDFSPDGKILAAASGWSIRRWETATGKRLPPLDSRPPAEHVALAAWGRMVATAGGGEVLLWDGTSGKQMARFTVGGGSVSRVALSPDGKRLAAAGTGGTVVLWNVTSREQRQLRGPKADVTALAFTADGSALVAEDSDLARVVWDAATGRELLRSPALVGHKKDPNFDRFWPVVAWLPEETKASYDAAFALSPSGGLVARCGYTLQVWELSTHKPRWSLPGKDQATAAVRFSPDGRYLAARQAQDTVQLFDALTGTELRSLPLALPGPDNGSQGFPVPRGVSGEDGAEADTLFPDYGVAVGGEPANFPGVFSADGAYLVTVDGPSLLVAQTATGTTLSLPGGHRGGFLDVAFSPDARTLATTGADGTVLLWDLPALVKKPSLPLSAEDLTALWKQLTSTDAAKAFAAQCRLERHPRQAIALVRGKLRPAVPADPARLAQLLEDLESDRLPVREAASAALAKLGDGAKLPLEIYLAGEPSLEGRRQAERLLAKIHDPLRMPKELRALRAVELLERLGSADAQAMLGSLAGGAPLAGVTRTARAGLLRLGARDAASRQSSRGRGAPASRWLSEPTRVDGH
jgi:WD40 repeat protein